MRKINKSDEPVELTKWKRKNKNARYDDLDKDDKGVIARQAINQKNITDQFGLCAYCCKPINEKTSINEHLVPQDKNHRLELDFKNIVASCITENQCDNAHKNQHLSLTPLMDQCETELLFFLFGDVQGKTDRANETISVLNLNNKKLRETRKQIVDTLLITKGMPPDDLLDLEEDDELLNMLIADFKIPKDGLLEPFSPIIINILQSYLISD